MFIYLKTAKNMLSQQLIKNMPRLEITRKTINFEFRDILKSHAWSFSNTGNSAAALSESYLHEVETKEQALKIFSAALSNEKCMISIHKIFSFLGVKIRSSGLEGGVL